MIELRYKHLIFDFDGVLAETNAIRTQGFKILFSGYEQGQIDEMMEYVHNNGGLSRYEKFKYFYEMVLHKPISAEQVQILSAEYTKIVKQKVIEVREVEGALDFLNEYREKYDLAIVSGSDQRELRDICRNRNITRFFKDILGSPMSKEKNMEELLKKYGWIKDECVYIGDSINDYHAARSVGVDFIGRNSGMTNWLDVGDVQSIDNLSQLADCLSINYAENA